jgi:hypothetical protein
MKIEITNGFKPVSITLTIETQDELDFFASLFNHKSVCDSALEFAELDLPPIFEELGGDPHKTSKINLTRVK